MTCTALQASHTMKRRDAHKTANSLYKKSCNLYNAQGKMTASQNLNEKGHQVSGRADDSEFPHLQPGCCMGSAHPNLTLIQAVA
mmetsp:Transcript_26831/g.48477  ORF Transcript_26831/g.48477 Transcript_26831/m.48477 type:complete len:84 (-) Transcript_26831:1610-1861(-)